MAFRHHLRMDWSVVVPLKPPQHAKSRLRAGGADAHTNTALVLAFAQDALAAALGASGVRRAVLVCDDDTATAVLRAGLDGPSTLASRYADRIIVVNDPPGAGLNGALRIGEAAARAADGANGIAALLPDLPALTSAVLDDALALAAEHPRAFVPDHDGTGTTLLCARSGPLDPHFGAGSAAAHEQSGAVRLDADIRLRLDVDTAADLDINRELGVGIATTGVLAAVRHRPQTAG